ALGLARAVVKPEYGATASGLGLVARDDHEGLARAAAALGMTGIVQPVIDAIAERGETSLVFIDGNFTHAVCKRPQGGDIRCQAEFGGTVARVAPPGWAIDAARRVLSMLPDAPLYARVDAVLLDADMRLMEVELIEPELFFPYCPQAESGAETGAAARFAAALMKRL
ncbi:MAG: ATP-grasp domain-containing protein, partial [Hyphococcus sp.]